MSQLARSIDITKVQLHCKECSLVEICLPHGLNVSEVNALSEAIENKPIFQKGELIFKTGEQFKALYAVKSGSIKVSTVAVDGEEQVLGFYLPGELVGLDGIGIQKHVCNATALETTSLCEIPYEKIGDLCHQFRSLQSEIHSLMSKEISEDKALLLLLAKRNADERVVSFILSLSRRYRERGFSEIEFNLSMPRQDIANYLGLATETISRILGKLQDEGLLSVNRRLVTINDLARLKKIVPDCAGGLSI